MTSPRQTALEPAGNLSRKLSLVLSLLLLFCAAASAFAAATTINPGDHLAYGANIGWMDCRGDTNSGAVIGEYVCSGYIYAANVGWINLGSGSPSNGIQYQNFSGGDFGVNQDGLGNLRGYAWGANIGWINFEASGAPKVDLRTGQLTGYIYSANCGWISLSNAVAYVQTDTLAPGTDSDRNGLPDAWERLNFGTIGVNPEADPDGDGMSNTQEYLAGTNPNDTNDKFAITAYTTTPDGALANLTWMSTPTRWYYIEKTSNLTASVWFDSGLGVISPDGATTTRMFTDTLAPSRFCRVRAVKPLSP